MSSSKVHDPEETSAEQARRLLRGDVERFMEKSHRLRERLRRHARQLSHADRQSLSTFLRRDSDMTLGVIDDLDRESTVFEFPSEADWS